MGSWKIIATSLPRTARMALSSSARISISGPPGLLNLMDPSSMLPPPRPTRRIMDSEVTDFPEPDSPTTPSVLPEGMENDTSSTLRTIPLGVANEVLRPFTSSSGIAAGSVIASTPAHARIDIAIENVDQQIDADIDYGAEHDECLHHRIVLAQDPIDHQSADPRPDENPLDKHAAP